jgi:4'-phosphopantetheinyl transferase
MQGFDQPGWLSQRLAEVPHSDAWLGPHERRALAELHVERRRTDWLLGRWTAKAALGRRLGAPPRRIEVLAAADGAPEAWLDGEPVAVSVSLSHRGGRALAAVADSPQIVGCDLELIEPRSEAFVREWLSSPEQRLIGTAPDRAQLANLIWAAKEAGAKVRRQGLRLDVRGAVVTLDAYAHPHQWRPLQIDWDDGVSPTAGWWRAEQRWVMVIAAEPAPAVPRELVADPIVEGASL